MPSSDCDRFARAAFTCIAEPGDPILRALLRVADPGQILQWIHDGDVPTLVHDRVQIPARSVRSRLDRWRHRGNQALDGLHLEKLEDAGIRLVCPGATEWPSSLDDLGDAVPYALWVRGDHDLHSCTGKSIAIVGSRAATGYGSYVAAEIAQGIGLEGLPVVSGAAYGIDAAAHGGALAADLGTTVAVLACGADVAYPAGHRGLLDAIARRGLVISELPPGARPTRLRFLQRNRIIAAITSATVVVEAGRHSGALSTARRAAELGRPVMAVPGPVTSAQSHGCHDLIRTGSAACVTSAADITELISTLSRRSS